MIPKTPSWTSEPGIIRLWDRFSMDSPPDVIIEGPLADKLLEVLSWVAGQTMYLDDPEPDSDQEDPLPSREELDYWKHTLATVAYDITGVVSRLADLPDPVAARADQ